MSKLFLVLDASTQSVSAIVIDHDTREVVHECSINFEHDLPQYGARTGVLPHPNPTVKHAPPLMWVEALDMLFARMHADGVRLHDLLAISGSGQQHGSIYLNVTASYRLARLRPGDGLAASLSGVFARPTAPIWMDSSTTQECEDIRDALGGVSATAELAGSDAFERFTGPQMRKFYTDHAEDYGRTTDIALVSSFLAGLLAGRIAPIDHGDGAGMNLMDIQSKTWSPDAVRALGAALRAAHGYFVETTSGVSWDDLLADYVRAGSDTSIMPSPNAVRAYGQHIETYAVRERQALDAMARPLSPSYAGV